MSDKKINIAITGGGCTGKSTLAANLFAHLKNLGYDYDLIFDEFRRLKKEFGDPQSPFDRFYMWRQQEREELRSTAKNGFITDLPLFHYYASARQYAKTERDKMAIRELFRMCLEIEDRYQLIIIAKNPEEIRYQTNGSRHSKKELAGQRHAIIKSFVEHFWSERLLYVEGDLEKRLEQSLEKVKDMHS